LRSLAEIEKRLEQDEFEGRAGAASRELLTLGEDVLAHWIRARNLTATQGKVEGFRLLALHRQGARGDPSFNACRESCRELIYHYNLITLDQDHTDTSRRLRMMRMVAAHIYYFIAGKMQNAQLGEFCCSSRSLRLNEAV
jgi:hypothetical protein